VYPSDFGKQRMAEEAKYGPRGIWKEDEDHLSEDDEDEDGDENNSLYDQIETNESGDEEQEDDEEEGSDVEESEEVEEPVTSNFKSKGKKE
jgi:nitrogen fixation-related uncharacterized protein